MIQKTIEQERNFNIFKDPSGDLMLLIRARLENEEKPTIAYDGGEHALLYRNGNNTIVLDYIHPAVRGDLARLTNILVVEAQGESIIREYQTAVQKTEHLDLPPIETR